MIKYIFFFYIILITNSAFSNDNLLTVQQQIERLQREVSDLSQTVFSNENEQKQNNNNEELDSNLVSNLSAIDMRIYDLEKDVKNLNANLEEIYFQIEDILNTFKNYEDTINQLNESLLQVKNQNNKVTANTKTDTTDDNTLGSLKINSKEIEENINIENNIEEIPKNIELQKELTPEDQFQLAFDNIRNKNWDEAKDLLILFIQNNPTNQLSGSAHYWLGELYLLEEKFRDAALTFAEGFQKFPDSIKAPDMLYKLSTSLNEVDKKNESCKTLEKLLIDFPKSKFDKKAKKQFEDYNCAAFNE